MSVLSPTQLEDHPLGTVNINAIVHANWTVLNNWLKKAPYRLESGDIDGTATGTTNIVNNLGVSIIPRAFIFVPVTFDAVTAAPTLKIGDSADDDEFLASVLLNLDDDTLVERLDALGYVKPVADGENIEVEITGAATGTTYTFKVIAIFDFMP